MATVINVQSVNETINSVNRQISTQENSLNRIDGIVNSMNGIWEAEDQRVYSEQFQGTKQKIQSFNQGVREALQAMQTYVNDCVNTDRQYGRSLRSVSW